MNCQTLSKFFLQNIKAISILLQTVTNWPIKMIRSKYDIFMLPVGQGKINPKHQAAKMTVLWHLK
jgi:hypothetical protein